ncbi:hypothetical protein HK102_011866, partial [Quaeritorhiza haematococci]
RVGSLVWWREQQEKHKQLQRVQEKSAGKGTIVTSGGGAASISKSAGGSGELDFPDVEVLPRKVAPHNFAILRYVFQAVKKLVVKDEEVVLEMPGEGAVVVGGVWLDGDCRRAGTKASAFPWRSVLLFSVAVLPAFDLLRVLFLQPVSAQFVTPTVIFLVYTLVITLILSIKPIANASDTRISTLLSSSSSSTTAASTSLKHLIALTHNARSLTTQLAEEQSEHEKEVERKKRVEEYGRRVREWEVKRFRRSVWKKVRGVWGWFPIRRLTGRSEEGERDEERVDVEEERPLMEEEEEEEERESGYFPAVPGPPQPYSAASQHAKGEKSLYESEKCPAVDVLVWGERDSTVTQSLSTFFSALGIRASPQSKLFVTVFVVDSLAVRDHLYLQLRQLSEE